MMTFIRAQLGSIAGSLVDFAITAILVNALGCWYLAANLTGNILGGITQFLLSRSWVFRKANGRIQMQFVRYAIFFCGNLLLSAIFVFTLTHYLRLNYLVSKTISSVILGLTYNFFVQKYYVFSK